MKPTRILFKSVGQLSKIKPCLECIYLNTQTKTCGKYSQQDIVMDKICNLPAITCREDETKCGNNARDHKQMTARELGYRDFYDHYSIPLLLMANTAVWLLVMTSK